MIKLRNFNLEKIDKIKHYSLLMKLNRDKGVNDYISHDFISFLDNNEEFATEYIPVGDKIAISKRRSDYE